jgi:aerobic carbon-monoxide dehydrogenase medium subunit
VKSPAFAYHAPDSVDEAAALLARYGADARPLAGGQSLVPLMHRRLVRPAALVDLNRVRALDGLRPSDEGLAVGAMARQIRVERSSEAFERWPMLREALVQVAHPGIRNRGTVVGSVCHADPSAELPSVAVALDARLRVVRDGELREAPARTLFVDRYQTALREGELAVELLIPAPRARSGSAWLELSRRRGDLPVVGVAAVVAFDGDGRCVHVRAVCANVAPTPFDAHNEVAPLLGERLTEESARAVGESVGRACDPVDDYQGTKIERRRVVAVLVRRALLRAARRAEGGG